MTKIKNMLKKGFTLTELAIVIAVIAILVAVLVPTFISLINSANESKDTQMIYNVNQALSIENATNSIETPEDALNAAAEAGYNIDKLTPTSDSEIYYDQENVRFVIKFSDGTYYPSSASNIDLNATTTWHFVSTNDLTAETDGSYTIAASYSVILTNNATTTESSAATAQTAKLSVGSSKVAAVAEESVTSGITINYKGMGSIDTSKADNIASINYTYTTTEGVTATKIIFNTTALTVNVTTSSNITINSYNSENTITKIVKAYNSGDVKVTINDNKGSVYQGDDSVITVNGDEATVVDSNVTVDTASGIIQLGNEKYPYLISSENDLSTIATKANASSLSTVYFKLTANIVLTSSQTINLSSDIVIDGSSSYKITSTSSCIYAIYFTGAKESNLSIELNNTSLNLAFVYFIYYEQVSISGCEFENSRLFITCYSSENDYNVNIENSSFDIDYNIGTTGVTDGGDLQQRSSLQRLVTLSCEGTAKKINLNVSNCSFDLISMYGFYFESAFEYYNVTLEKITADLNYTMGQGEILDSLQKTTGNQQIVGLLQTSNSTADDKNVVCNGCEIVYNTFSINSVTYTEKEVYFNTTYYTQLSSYSAEQ